MVCDDADERDVRDDEGVNARSLAGCSCCCDHMKYDDRGRELDEGAA